MTSRLGALVCAAALWLASATAGAAGVPVDAATPQQTEQARAAYAAAKKSYDAGKLDAALIGFMKSYEIVASPNSHLMVARTLADLGRYLEAYRESTLTVKEAEHAAERSPKYKKTLETARAQVIELRQKVGFLKIAIAGGQALPENATVEVGDRLVRDIGEPIVVAPGPIRVRLTNEHGSDLAEAEVLGGGEASVLLEIPEPAAPPPPLPRPPPAPLPPPQTNVPRVMAFVSGGVGAAGLLVFGVLGGLSLNRFDDLEGSCLNGTCPEGSQDAIDEGKTFQVGANIGLCVGIGGVIAAVALFLYDAEESGAAIEVAPVPHGVGIGGRF